MDKKYWENYYKDAQVEYQPSPFAQFVFSNYLGNGSSLLELGCGNGRDSLYFARHGIKVLAVDQCENEINTLKKTSQNNNLNYIAGDFTQLGEIGTFDKIYSRFTLHSISEEQEDRVLKWSYDNMTLGGHLCIEARGQKNEIYKLGEKVIGEEHAYIYNNHYRRFVNIDTLARKLLKKGFDILMQEEKKGFAPYADTNYTFLRIIALKK